jgi:hypothetical protein
MSKLTIIAAIAASIATPALAADPPYARALYDYFPASDIGVATPYSNLPAATGGGSYGYNVGVLRDSE